MQMLRVNRFKIFFASAVALTLCLALIVTATRGEKNNRTERPHPVTKTNSTSLFKDNGLGMSDRDRFNDFVNGKKPFSSAEEASKELPFKLKLPNSRAVGKLNGIFVDKQGGELPPFALVFYGDDDPVNGISLSARLDEQKFDAKAYVDQMVASKEAGELKSDNVPFLVDINGNPGSAQEPGYNVLGSEKRSRPGGISWEDDNGIFYILGGTSGDNTTSVETLLEIARSISSK